MVQNTAKRTRLAVDLPPNLRRRAKIAAARREVTLQQYVRRAIEKQLAEDLPDAIHAADDPVLAELWDNEADAVYDDL
jgi:predicted DNA-binding protein